MCRVAVVSRAGGGGGGGEGCGGGEGGMGGWGILQSLRTHECTQVDAWPMLIATAGKKHLERHYVHPGKH